MTEVTESSIFCVISNPSKSGPQVVEAKERATTLLLTVGMIMSINVMRIKEMITNERSF